MYILTNPLLSKNFMYYNMKLNANGLFYISQSEDGKISYQIFMTKDVNEIIQFMNLPNSVLDVDMKREDFFDILVENKYFKTKKFVYDPSEGGCIMLSEMSEYLKNKDFDIRYENITIEYISEFFKDNILFHEKYEKCIKLINNGVKKYKLSGLTILSLFPNFDKYKLGEFIDYFNNEYFEDDIEKDYFLMRNDMYDMRVVIIEIMNKIKMEH
jgi:hypothetical protein